MNYCKHCMIPTDEENCPVCGEKHLWPVLPEDPCFVGELGVPWSDIFADVLRQKQIPCLMKPLWGGRMDRHPGQQIRADALLCPLRIPAIRPGTGGGTVLPDGRGRRGN